MTSSGGTICFGEGGRELLKHRRRHALGEFNPSARVPTRIDAPVIQLYDFHQSPETVTTKYDQILCTIMSHVVIMLVVSPTYQESLLWVFIEAARTGDIGLTTVLVASQLQRDWRHWPHYSTVLVASQLQL